MSQDIRPVPAGGAPRIYQIRLQGHLDGRWSDWFDGLIVTRGQDGQTLLTGPVPDQAALYGLLKKVRDLGLPLLALNAIEPAATSEPPASKGESKQ